MSARVIALVVINILEMYVAACYFKSAIYRVPRIVSIFIRKSN